MNRRQSGIHGFDKFSILLYGLILLSGLVAIYMADYQEAHAQWSWGNLVLKTQYGKQATWIIIGMISIFLVRQMNSSFFEFIAYKSYVFIAFLLLLVLLIGMSTNGALSWITIGPIKIQPSEFMKLAVCLSLARFLSISKGQRYEWRDLFIAGAIIVFPIIMIVLQRDAGTALLYTSLILVLYRAGLVKGFYLFIFLCVLMSSIFALKFGVMMTYIPLYSIVLFSLFLSKTKNKLVLEFIIAVLAGVFLWFVLYLLILRGTYVESFLEVFNLPSTAKLMEETQGEELSFPIVVGFVIHACVFLLPSLFLFFKFYLQKQIAAARILLVLSVCLASLYVSQVAFYFLQEHQQKRIQVFLGLIEDPLNYGWDSNQIEIAIGSGGWLGKGWLESTQIRNDFVTEKSTDFIFCTVGEVGGFLWSACLIILYTALCMRILWLAERQHTPFGRYYGYSIACFFFFHYLINVGMHLQFVPIIGIPLPLFSYGGSSLLTFTLMLFVFLKIDSERLLTFRG